VLTEMPLRANNVVQFADAEIISTFIYSKHGRDALEKFPALKLVATRSTGYDHIDTRYCAEHGITISNLPTYGENTVAEHVFTLLLAISHRLPQAMERARSGRFALDGLEGFDLQGKALGVIGTGNIGAHVIRIARFRHEGAGLRRQTAATTGSRMRLHLRRHGRSSHWGQAGFGQPQ